jgi:flagellar assembly factor FliW
MIVQSVRFGAFKVAREHVIEFPLGLIGLGGSCFTLIDRSPGTGFMWLHALDDPALALPVVRPEQFFSNFELQLAQEDRELTGIESLAGVRVYVTVRPMRDPREITANLRAPLLVREGRGWQVINACEQAPLQAPLFTLHAPDCAAPARLAAQARVAS